MPTTYVAIDIETTGLDPDKDAIIEVGAITFRGADILDEFSTLINPPQEIPPFITQLTGITNEMVADAPSLFTVRPQLNRQLADYVLVGHNVEFDLGFLRAARIGVGNHRIDTLTLASILFPESGRYSLEALVRYLRLPDPAQGQTHRALDDAEQTVELFLALREAAQKLPYDTLNEIVQSGRQLGWPETIFFEEVLAAKAQQAFTDGSAPPRGQRLARLFRPAKVEGQALAPLEQPARLDVDVIAAMIQPGGNFSRAFPAFEYRPQQVEMLETVAYAFNDGVQLLVEAGTGTGKSVAYLLPAAFWATQNGRRVVISTNTINLQDQLINKDIPELQRLLPFELRAAVRKGRSNYLCTRLFQQMRHTGPGSADEMAVYARILCWLPHTQTGDVAELPLRTQGERLAWSRLNGENASCTQDQCASENCPLHVARRRSEVAHLLIVNHSLLLADMATNNMVLPPFVDLIVDEAHHLEAAVTDGLSFRADRRFLEAILDEVSSDSGLIGNLQKRLREALAPQAGEKVDTVVNGMRREAEFAGARLDEFFTALAFFFADQVNHRSQFSQQIRITPAVRAQPGYDELEITWDNLNKHLHGIADGLQKLAAGLQEVAFELEDGEELMVALQSNGRSLAETRENLDGIILNPKDSMIYWVDIWKDRMSLHAAPLHVGPLVEEHIFGKMEAVIMTSATLRTANAMAYDEEADFTYIRERLHAYDSDEAAVGSPFDYESNTLLYLVSDIPEPNQPGYQRYVEQAIIDVATALNGRTMVLFTSYGQLSQTARAISGPLSERGISTLAQSSGSSRQQLLEQFKQPDSRTVLLGTRSFWEGVDVPGEALQAVVIAKLPFDVPSDPIFAARSETFDNSFFEYSIPEAVLRFRQGFGRLNRRQTDEGIVVVLDKRVLTKRYGQLFIDALPTCTVIRQRSGRLGELTVRWFNRDR